MKARNPEKLNFLIVEDVDSMRRSIRAMLKLINFGREIFEAANGRDAWRLLQNDDVTVDFIISDYNMPHMSGTELLGHLRENSKYRDIPFLMITAEANMDVVAEAAEKDVDAYMTKPFITATLEQKIRELLDRASNPDPLTMHLQKARLLEETNDIDGAIAAALTASRVNSQSSRPHRELGRLYLKKGIIEEARTHFETAIDLNKLDVYSYHGLGQIYFRLGDYEQATSNFMRSMEISPRHASRAFDFARLLVRQKLLPQAEKVLKMVLKYRSTDNEFKHNIADFSLGNGLYSLAFRVYREIRRNDYEDPEFDKKIGLALFGLENDAEAVKYLEKAAAENTMDLDVMLSLAQAYLRMNLKIRADKWATLAIRLDPDSKIARKIRDKCT